MFLLLFQFSLVEIAIMIALNPRSIFQRRRSRPSFTLVELMVVVAVIGIMSSMLLYALLGAQRDALVARTQSTVKKINDVILYKWEEFRYRSLKVNIPHDFLQPVYDPATGTVIAPKISAIEAARLRLMVLRDTMRMELPDQFYDLGTSPARYVRGAVSLERSIPGAYNNLRQSFGFGPGSTLLATDPTTPIDPTPPPTDPKDTKPNPTPLPTDPQWDSAELLYQIVASTNYLGSSGLEYFRPTEIGDFDGDFRPEFIDAWGKPICFIRWPAGYGNSSYPSISPPPDSILSDRSAPDPMDPLQADPRWVTWNAAVVTSPNTPTPLPCWLLVPLIVSAGADGEFNLKFNTGVNYAMNLTNGFPDPFLSDQGAVENNSNGHLDNITNYSLLLE